MRVHDGNAEETSVQISEVKGIRVGEIVGNLDLTNSHTVLERLQEAADAEVFFIVSLDQCSFCDSHGLAALIALRRQMGERFAIVIPAGNPLRRLFEATSLDKLIHIEDCVQDAAGHLTGVKASGQ